MSIKTSVLMVYAPHLPPKITSKHTDKRRSFTGFVLLVLLIALAAGATAALSVVSWYPQLVGWRAPYPVYPINPSARERSAPADEHTLARSLRNASVRLYRASDLVRRSGLEWYPGDRALAHGVFLTTDGWVVTTLHAAGSTDIRLVDERFTVYRAGEVITDPVSGLAFLKIEGSGFATVPTVSTEAPRPGDTVYRLSGSSFTATVLGDFAYNRSKTLSSDAVERFARLPDGVLEGTPYFLADGRLLGFAAVRGNDTVLLPLSAAQPAYFALVSGKPSSPYAWRIVYTMLPDAVAPRVGEDPTAPRVGALVARTDALVSGGSRPALVNRDIITAVNEIPVSAHEDISFLLARMRGAREMLFTVYREGEYVRIPAIMGEQ